MYKILRRYILHIRQSRARRFELKNAGYRLTWDGFYTTEPRDSLANKIQRKRTLYRTLRTSSKTFSVTKL